MKTERLHRGMARIAQRDRQIDELATNLFDRPETLWAHPAQVSITTDLREMGEADENRRKRSSRLWNSRKPRQEVGQGSERPGRYGESCFELLAAG